MSSDFDLRTHLNRTKYRPGQRRGHYESFYQRANHPTRPIGFWIRYTIFSPEGLPENAIGELWAVFFNRETGEHVVVKEEHPVADCEFSPLDFHARVAGSTVGPEKLVGQASTGGDAISWSLSYDSEHPSLLLQPEYAYSMSFPKAKALVGSPLARFHGHLVVNDERIDIDGWIGSQNHNWGSAHTDYYAFGQVAGFDNDTDAFLELVTAQVKAGPVKLPFATMLVLRTGGRELRMNSLLKSLRKESGVTYFHWNFSAENGDARIEGAISAPREAFVGLNYYNPAGGIKHCLNTKVGDCTVTVFDKKTKKTSLLHASGRALFEILTDDRNHGITIRA